MTDYYEGAAVKITATFSFDVTENVYFELDNLKIQYHTEADGLEIILDPTNSKRCWVIIDTMGLVGEHAYHFYSRGSYKAAIKGKFKVV